MEVLVQELRETRCLYQAQTGVIGLSEDRMGGIEDQLGQEDLVLAFVHLTIGLEAKA